MKSSFNENMKCDLAAALVVDDDELFRTSFAEMLRRDFHFGAVLEARTLDRALEVLAERPDISFASFELPTGEASARFLQKLRKTFPRLCIIVVSSSRRPEDMLLAVRAGVRGYLLKRWSAGEIAAAVTRVLEGAISLPATVAQLPAQPSRSAGPISKTAGKADVQLTPRQRYVLQLLRKGKSNKQIARELNISQSTVNSHTMAIYRTLGVHNRASLAAIPEPPANPRQLS